MRYSVFNPATMMFDYFETPEERTSVNAPAPTHLVSRTLGSTVEQAAWPLPADAAPIGSGPHAIGRVAIPAGRALAGDVGGGLSIAKGLLLAAAGALAVKVLAPRRKRR
jgi:hypothetical protein